MFDKNLFLELCEKYDVELSDSTKGPMIRDGNGVHMITGDDVSRYFSQCKTFFGYSGEKLDANVMAETYYLYEDFAIAC